MNLTNIQTIKKLCQEYGIRPSKKLGQNFLIPSTREDVLDKIVEAAELKKDDVVLEIGPGFGVLTQELVECAGKVVAVEKDKRLADFIKTLKHKNIKTKLKVMNDDVLNLPPRPKRATGSFGTLALIKWERYKVVSNLPYQITSPVLWKFLHEEKHKPELMVLMMQKEVAERIVAKPGKMSILSVMCQFYAEPEIVSIVKRENFWPVPEVDSAIIKLKLKKFPRCSAYGSALFRDKDFKNTSSYEIEDKLLKIIKIGFSNKRKMLKNNLAKGLKIPADEMIDILKKAGLDAKIRAQELSVNDWIKINKQLTTDDLRLTTH